MPKKMTKRTKKMEATMKMTKTMRTTVTRMEVEILCRILTGDSKAGKEIIMISQKPRSSR